MAGVDRRTVLKGVGGAAALGVSAFAVTRFDTPDREQDPATCSAEDISATDKRLVFSNWPEYIDEDDGDYVSTLTQFEKDTGIKVRYTADVNDNNEFFAKVSNQLGSCSSSKRDLFALTDWMAARMIQVGWIQKLDATKVPNLHANIIDSLKSPDWDPKREYSAPWQSGLTGIAYNKAKVGEIKSFKELLTRKDLKGRISLLTEMRDTMAFLLLIDGADPANFTPDQWDTAVDLLRKARSDGQVRSFTGNEYVQDLASGNVVACEAWSGDIANAGDENLVWIPPEEGIIIWADNMLVPNLATHQANAERLIDYYYEPEVAAKLAAYNSFICPVKGAQEAMQDVDPEQVDNELIFPTEETLSKTHRFMALDEATMRTYEGDFADVTGA
ncbi:polyamine ABC transporter substrate-binding protein [Aeromicrobium wangtongii]|uniref:Spermidine/putrescine ABC transporter substrate-binding protein n=1 Tax=Aeromicrobium wangtongii TaxID=2969247 RepID=A0ABY5M6T6_9ACTN|nr:spermidine/putrescine ABC transporter substrate-binding protein [Aeromicrobium wangtongii]MCD9198464.1 spermidine/putrescine ABC transporter substrate-binding protein [Aeromicrobium wangtongii]UUP12492.1 spermidine/putrescine ABC transporter substrate-binding protein [Aeromicrobium wangtongii]